MMSFELHIVLTCIETGRLLHADVKVIGVGKNVATEIRCEPHPDQEEQEFKATVPLNV